MKNLLSLLLVVGLFAMAGCEGAKEKLEDAKKAGADAAEKAKDMANFDLKGLTDKFSAITGGFKDLSGDNVDGLTSKITDLTGSIDGMGIDKLSGVAKTGAMEAIKGFIETVKKAMEGVTDEGILSKLKPVIGPLMEKLNAFK